MVLHSNGSELFVPQKSDLPWKIFWTLHQHFEELQRSPDISSVLARYHADFAPGARVKNSMRFSCIPGCLLLLRKVAHQPITVAQLRQALSEICPMTNEQVISFIAVRARAEKDGVQI